MKPAGNGMDLGRWIDDLVAGGRSSFTTDEARGVHGGTYKAVQAVLRRLRAKGEIASPLRGFHLVVPPEYRRLGCLPPLWFIDDLARHLGQPYYVALLSAAELHGAAHQRPQAFQVMRPRPHRSVECGGVRIDFVMRGSLASVPVVLRHTPKGTVRIATPEATAFDLVGYVHRCGGLVNVATVLRELAEELDPVALAGLAPLSPVPWAQRLGFLLDLVGSRGRTGPLSAWVRDQAPPTCALDVDRPPGHGPVDRGWRVVVNVEVEVDR